MSYNRAFWRKNPSHDSKTRTPSTTIRPPPCLSGTEDWTVSQNAVVFFADVGNGWLCGSGHY